MSDSFPSKSKPQLVASQRAESSIGFGLASDVPSIGVTQFIQRQTADSAHNHFDGSWEELAQIVSENFHQGGPSPQNSDAWIVPIPEEHLGRFYTSTWTIDENTRLEAAFKPRREGEAPVIQITGNGQKQQAKKASVVLYRPEMLSEEVDVDGKADWYMVKLIAQPTDEDEPMSPTTMVRNELELPGGTKPARPYTAEDYRKSIEYWYMKGNVSVRP